MLRTSALRLAAVAAGFGLCVSSALASDPPPPPGGFAVQTLLAQPITFSDGHQSRMDLYYPDTTFPASGWPGVMVNHGSGGNRSIPDIVRAANYLAAAGYVVYSMDLRGNSAGNVLERELLDQAEGHGLAQALLPGAIDSTRLAVTGFSGGGVKSFMAAAWSGKTLPLAGFVTTYPEVKAVAPEIASLARQEVSAPGGVLASDHVAKPTDPAVLTALAIEDYALFTSLLHQPFFDDMQAELMNSTVPILGMWAAQDTKIVNNPSLDLFNTLPMTKRLHLSTGGHSTVKTTHEREVQQEMRRRWFDRFVKGIQNGADLEPFAEIGVQPTSNAAHADLNSVWEHRNTNQWPPAISKTSLFLRAGGSLDTAPPFAVETGPIVNHRVTPFYDLLDYNLNGGGLDPVAQFPFIPMAQIAFDSPPLNEAAELLGRSRVRVFARDNTGVFQLSAMLTHVDPLGEETWISMGTAGVRDGVMGDYEITIDLDDVAHVIPEGHIVRLRLMNLADHNPPGSGRRIRIVPYFTDTDTQIRMEPGAVSELRLPLRKYESNMRPRLAEVDSTSLSHQFDLSGGLERAGMGYFMLASASGEAPGLSVSGYPTIPVNADEWTLGSLQSFNTVLFPMSAGVLDANGDATPGFSIPMPVSTAFAGYRFTFSTLVFDGVALDSVTPATTLLINP